MTNRGLIILAGVIWFGVGIMLNAFAIRWFGQLTRAEIIWAISLGIIIGVLKVIFIFKKLIDKNILRIKKINGKAPWWKFQRPGAYYLIFGMMALGIFLRTTGIVAKKYLAPVYIGVGLALALGSIFYFKAALNLKK